MTDPRRDLPSVDALLSSEPFAGILARHPRDRVVRRLRARMDEVRSLLGAGGDPGDLTGPQRWADDIQPHLDADDRPSLRRVLNATGVVLHTNLGRAPLADAARIAMAEAAQGYSNLEYDLEAGVRGSRYDHCTRLLTELTGAEAALVVNNAAAALVLVLVTTARDRGVAVSRGELVEIGGGFRIPEILGRSGARLVEVGSTNRTRVGDYAAALEEADVAALLKVHRSNFRIRGFTEETSLADLSELARGAGIPCLYDLGSGMLADPAALGLPDEPRTKEALAGGADLVVASGDKLLGGPQAGIVVGRADLVDAMRKNPLCRALRVDKVTLAGLEATLRLYLDPERAVAEIPTLRMLATPPATLRARAEALLLALDGLDGASVEEMVGAVGGGTYPDTPLPSWGVVLRGRAPETLAQGLRDGQPPVVGRIEDDRLLLDVRTVDDAEVVEVGRRVREVVERDSARRIRA